MNQLRCLRRALPTRSRGGARSPCLIKQCQKYHRPMIFERYTITVFESGLFGRSGIYQYPLTVVTFKRLSERTKIAALRLGYSPPIDLPARIPFEDGGYTNEWILKGETAAPVYSIYLGDDDESGFFDEPIDLLDSSPSESES